jgi:lipid-A-disaccharide synthase-like uncharacterized protein
MDEEPQTYISNQGRIMMIASLFGWFTHLFGAWTWWFAFGFVGQMVFAGRFAVQAYASEKKKQSVIPISFWYMSLTGSVILLIYGFHLMDPVYILAYLFNSVVYIRNLMFIHRAKTVEQKHLTIK